MKTIILTTLFSLFFFCMFAQPLNAQTTPSEWEITVDAINATYSIGETVNFTVTSTNSGTFDYSIFYDERTPALSSGNLTLEANVPIVIPFTLNEAGVVLLQVNKNGISELAAAAFEPFAIQVLETEPIDFDAFWQTARTQLDNIPIDPQVTLFSNNGHSTTYRMNLAQVEGRRVYGYITIPNGTGPFPAMLSLPSFGYIANLVSPSVEVTEEGGFIHMNISIHDEEPDQTVVGAYSPNDINDPNQIYNKFAILAGVRAIDYLFTRPDFDGTNIGVMGVSQGAGLSVVLAGLDSRVNLLIHSNPANSQLLGLKYGKAAGFPYYLNTNSTADQQNNVKYYEAAYFAKRYTGPSWTLISHEDLVTPAAGSFAVFNQLPSPKILTHSIDLDHNHPAEFWNDRHNFIRRYFSNTQTSIPFARTTTGYFIDAGADQTLATNTNVLLSGIVQLENQTNPNFPVEWSQVDGPGIATFDTPTTYSTSVNFSANGTYTLQLIATDNEQLIGDRQFFTLIDEVKITVGNCVDNDNDGICVSQDCNDMDDSIPALVGSTCDDGDELTENDVIQTDGCSCLGVVACTDNDGDGFCIADDCDDNNSNLPTTVGTSCNDGDPTTTNDVIQADGCSCLGSTSSGGPADCTIITAVGGSSQITISNLLADREEINIIGSPTNWQNVLICDEDCTNTETISNLTPGTYSVKINNYGDDGSYCYFSIDVVVTDAPCTDMDNDGFCVTDDCDDNNPNLPTTVGAACDDGDANTINDVIQTDGCTCLGSTSCTDTDNDGFCLADDCDDNNSSLPATVGTSCDDGDAATTNDVIQADGCSCLGSTSSGGPADCTIITAVGGSSQIIISNLLADREEINIIGSSTNWQNVLICDEDCTNIEIVSNLNPGTYTVKINNYGDDGSYCYFIASVVVTDGPCIDGDNDGFCLGEDCDDSDSSFPTTVGANCDDGNTNTINDAIQADGCTCAGTLPSTDPTCDDVQVAIIDNTMQITGITAPIAIIKVFTENYSNTLLNCVNNCGTSQVIENLSPQTYHLNIQFYTASWAQICTQTIDVDYSQFQSIANSRNKLDTGDEPFKVYPNPAKEQVYITVPKSFKDSALKLQIINALGQIVLQQTIPTNNNSVFPISLNSLNKGIYFLKIEQERKRIFVEKILVE